MKKHTSICCQSQLLGGFFPFLCSLIQFTTFHFWRFAIKHVHRLDAIIYHPDGTVKKTHKVAESRNQNADHCSCDSNVDNFYLVVSPSADVN